MKTATVGLTVTNKVRMIQISCFGLLQQWETGVEIYLSSARVCICFYREICNRDTNTIVHPFMALHVGKNTISCLVPAVIWYTATKC